MKTNNITFNQFKQIKIVSTGYTRPGSRNAEEEVNKYLQEGWELLETYTTCYSNNPPLTSQQEVHFVLGKKEIIERNCAPSVLQA